MRNKVKVLVVFICACMVFNSPARGAVTEEGFSKGTFGVGLNYPGIGARYFFLDRYAAEVRGQFATDIFVAGVRVSRYFRPVSQILPYVGMEMDYVSFEGSLSEGTGYALEVLAGGEYFVWREQGSVQLDFGPAYLALADEDFDVDVSGIEFVVNFGINYYF